MEIKSLFNLEREDFNDNSIWVDCEYAEMFYEKFNVDYDEDDVVKVQSNLYSKNIDNLNEIGRFYIGCSIQINNKTYNGISYIRASDFSIYFAELFYESEKLPLPLHKQSVTEKDIINLENKLKTKLELIYPVKINCSVNCINIEKNEFNPLID